MHLLFLDVDKDNCVSEALKVSLESKLDVALAEDDEARSNAAASVGDGGRSRREAMETDGMDNNASADAGDDPGAAGIRRRPPVSSPKPSISRPGTPGVKQEFSGGGVGEGGGRSRGRGGSGFGAGARGVYRLSDFKDYHEMKEKVCVYT